MKDQQYEPITDDNEVLCPGVDECRFRRTGELWSGWTKISGGPSTKNHFIINRPSYFEYEFRRPKAELTSTSQRIEYFCDQLKKTLLAKNADYGDSATKAPHLAPNTPAREAIEVRLSDKISRWRKLRLAGKAEVKESLEDTVLDTAGYCILWLCCVDETSIPGEQSTDN